MADATDPSQRLREQVEKEERKLRRAINPILPQGPHVVPGQGIDPGNQAPIGDWKEEWWQKYTKPPKEIEPILPYIPMPSWQNRGPDGRPLRDPINWWKWKFDF